MSKRALLIGVNKYKIPGADLRGCVNDVENIKSSLTKYFDFPASGIKTLTDFKATTKQMRKEIEKLVARAKRGDVILLHYSGHGANVPDDNGDEADNRDEILCPTDLDWYDPITDDWIREVFDSLASEVNFTVIMDCCHSGTNTRAIPNPHAKILPRFLPCPLDLMAVESGRSLKGKTRSKRKTRKRAPVGKKDVVNVKIPELLISGCRDDQTSADAYISGSYNGAMTYSLVRALNASRGKTTYRDVHTNMLKYLKGKYQQVPQLEGQKARMDHPFLQPY